MNWKMGVKEEEERKLGKRIGRQRKRLLSGERRVERNKGNRKRKRGRNKKNNSLYLSYQVSTVDTDLIGSVYGLSGCLV